jgi:FixJ family two-component response regulator
MDATKALLNTPLVSIVDDDLSVRRSIRRLLRSAGLRAETFASAEEFLASGRADSTACLILDLRMPGMDGLQLQQRLAHSSKSLPIIFQSAHSSEEDERKALQAGALHFLRKPVTKEALLHAIRDAIKTAPTDERKLT